MDTENELYREQLMKEIEVWLHENPYEVDEFVKGSIFSGGIDLIKQAELNQWFSNWVNQLPEEKRQIATEIVDQIVYYMTSTYINMPRLETMEADILRQARPFQANLTHISAMKQLSMSEVEYVESKYKNKYSLYALAEGGIAGLGKPLLLMLDFPALMTINLNLVHRIASCHGYSLKVPTENLLALKVLHAASLPKIYRREAWEWLLNHYHSDEFELHANIAENDQIMRPEFLETMAKQWVKSIALFGMRKINKNRSSILAMAIGANINYQFTNKIARFSSYFYRYRLLDEKMNR